MRVLQVNTVFRTGSIGRIASDICNMLSGYNYMGTVAYGRGKFIKRYYLISGKLSVLFHVLCTRIFDLHGLLSFYPTHKLIAIINKWNPDIVHLHNIHGYYVNYKILFSYLANKNIHVVWTLHDCWTFTGHCSHFSYIRCEKWKDICFACPQKFLYPASYIFDRSRKNYIDKRNAFLSISDKLTLVPVSNWLSNLCAQSFFRNVSIKRIYNGIDTTIFRPVSEIEIINIRKKYNIETLFVLIGIASVWSERKGFYDFIKLRSLLSNDYTILLVGLSEKQRKTLPCGIIGINKTEDILELSSIYASADIFVNPTYEDSFPTTNLEALACGTPVITYNTGGSTESITPGTGFVVEQGDIQGLLKSIKEIISKGRRYYSPICRDHALNFFNKEERYLEYLRLYEELINKN